MNAASSPRRLTLSADADTPTPPPDAPRPEVPRVLIVDDNPANLAAFEATLADTGYTLVTARSGAEAMRQLLKGDFAAILLDIQMPILDGLQTAALIRERDRTRDVPILFITAFAPDAAQVLDGYARGAVEYLVKPIAPEILRSKVRVFVDLFSKSKQIEWQAAQLRAINAQLQQEMAQRKEAERNAAFEREERQRVALAGIAEAVITSDGKGHATSLNPVAEKLIGWTAAAARGVPLGELLGSIVEEGEEPLEQIVRRCIAMDCSERAAEPVKLAVRGRGRRYIDYSVAPVHDRLQQVVGAVLIARDITDRHTVQIELAEALRREQAARKSAEDLSRARDEFLAVISHELRTPLSAIVGWVQVLRAGNATPEHAQQAFDAIFRGAMAQKKLIEDLLDMSRIVNGKISLDQEPVELTAIVGTAVASARPLADEKKISVQCRNHAATLLVHADRMRIEQVIWNILSNAVKFTQSTGRVEISLERRGHHACLVISDNGPGIDPVFLPHVFEAFRQEDATATRRQGGLGLGLAIAKEIVVVHGGTIEAHSAGLGHGAQFTVTLPLLDEAVHGAALPSPTHSGRSSDASVPERLRGLKILIVEDHPLTLEMLVAIARREHAQVQPAASVREALAILSGWQPDVLISDLSMPEEDGFTLLRRVRALPAHQGGAVPALALSAMTSAEERARALEAGFDAHLAKPLDVDALVNAIGSLVNEPARASGESAPKAS